MSKAIRDVMSMDPITVPAEAGIATAARAMKESDIGDVLVLDDKDQVCGIVTDRDIVVRVVAEGLDPSETKLGDICTRDLESVSPQNSVDDAVKLMSQKAIRRLPVIEDGKPVGIVSLGDLAITQDPDSGLADISEAPPNN
jgi:signal-transduction protein with cAMP-binding, CBS, and nucleotidyltransferase domain